MNPIHLLLALLVTAIWGLNFSVIKIGLQSVDPFILAGIRFALCAVPAVFFIRRPRVSWGMLAAYGLLFGVGLWGVVNLGIRAGVSAGVASLLLQFSAFCTILLGAALFHERVSSYQVAGIALALVGLGAIVSITDGSVSIAGTALVLLGAVSWSVANVIIKKSGTRDVLAFLVWSLLFAPLPLFALAYWSNGGAGFAALPAQLGATALLSILFQAYPTTLFGYWIWNSLLKRYPVSTVAPLSLLVPVFGVLGSVLIFGERLPAAKLSALVLILSGLVAGLYGQRIGAWLARQRTRSVNNI